MTHGDAEKITMTHIPALPGWFVGTAQIDDDRLTDGVWWEPVIAWVVRTSEMDGECTISWVEPISIGVVNEGERYVIRNPDGLIQTPDDGPREHDADVVNHWREQDIRTKQRSAANGPRNEYAIRPLHGRP